MLTLTKEAIDDDSEEYGQSLQSEQQGNSQIYSMEYIIPELALGQDATYTECGYTKTGHDSFLIATTNEAANSTRARSKCTTSLIGSGSSWAYTAKRLTITGTGSQIAYATFEGSYAGVTSPAFMGGSAGVRVRVSVYNLTTYQEVASSTILDVNDCIALPHIYEDGFVQTVPVRLEAGYTYIFRFAVSTSVSNYSPQIMIQSDFFDTENDAGVRMDEYGWMS